MCSICWLTRVCIRHSARQPQRGRSASTSLVRLSGLTRLSDYGLMSAQSNDAFMQPASTKQADIRYLPSGSSPESCYLWSKGTKQLLPRLPEDKGQKNLPKTMALPLKCGNSSRGAGTKTRRRVRTLILLSRRGRVSILRRGRLHVRECRIASSLLALKSRPHRFTLPQT